MIYMEIKNVGPGKFYVIAGGRWLYVDAPAKLAAAMAKLAAEIHRKTAPREDA